jgi:formaldehyde-activating enzyme involved in methanogenesis
MIEKAAKVSAAWLSPSVLAPPVTMIVANQTIKAAIHDQIQGFLVRALKEIMAAPPASRHG